MKGLSLFLAVVLMVAAAPVAALEIEWTPPTQRTDGAVLDPATELSHYNLYCGTTAGGPYTEAAIEIPATAPDGTFTTDSATFFPGYGDYFCTMTAIDTYGQESAFSNEVTVGYHPSPPASPTSVIVLGE